MKMSEKWLDQCYETTISYYKPPSLFKKALIIERAQRLYDLDVPARSAGIIIAEELIGFNIKKT